MIKKVSSTMILVVFSLMVACSSSRTSSVKTTSSYPAMVSAEVRLVYQQAEKEYKKKNFDQALINYQQLIDQFAHNQLTDESYYKVGKIHFLKHHWDQSIQAFLSLAKLSPDPEYKAKGYLLAGYAGFQKKDFKSSVETLRQVKPVDLSAKLKLQYYSLRILNAEQLSISDQEKYFYWLKLVDTYELYADRKIKNISAANVIDYTTARKKIKEWAFESTPLSSLPDWLENYPSGFSKPYADFKLAKTRFEAYQDEESKFELKVFIAKYPKHELVREVKVLLGEEDVSEIAGLENQLKIGVIVPLSGPNANFGKNILEAVQCASGLKQQCLENYLDLYPNLSVWTVETQDETDSSLTIEEKVETLIASGVKVIIGPISSESATRASKITSQKEVLLFPFTQKDVEWDGEYTFQLAYPLANQISDIIETIKKKRIRVVSILYPNNKFGLDLTEFFTHKADQEKLNVVAIHGFDPNTFELAEEARMLKLKVNQFDLETDAVGFDGLYIPDSYLKVNRLIPALNFVGINNIPIFGGSSFNDERITRDLSKSFPGSFFVDLYYVNNPSLLTTKFLDTYQEVYNRRPTSIEALAFDAVWFLRQIAPKVDMNYTFELSRQLTSARLVGVTSIYGFSKEGLPKIKPYILTSGPKGVELLDK